MTIEHLPEEEESLPSSDPQIEEGEFLTFDQQQKIEVPDARSIGIVPLGDSDEQTLRDAYDLRVAYLGTTAFYTRLMTVGSYENVLYSTVQNYSSEAERIERALQMIPESERALFTASIKNPNDPSGKSSIGSIGVSAPPPMADLSGFQGAAVMLSSRKGFQQRVLLVNSGFSVDITAPTPDQLNQLLNKCRSDTEEYGRKFGAHFYLYMDLVIKQNFFDMVISRIVLSSLKDWEKPGVLVQAIKLADYSHLLMAMCRLMYPNGYPNFAHYCTRPASESHPHGCDHVETIKLDMNSVIHTRFGKLSKEAINHLSRSRIPTAKVSPQTLDTYYQALGFDGQTLMFDQFVFTLRTPSMFDYLQAGAVFNADLLNEISADNTLGIYDAIAYRQMRAFLPYIARVDSVDAAGNVLHSLKDAEGIGVIIDAVVGIDDYREGFYEKMIEFINESQLTHVCYPTFECPACHHHPDIKSGFFTLDPQNTFFTQAYQRLTDIS